MPALQQNAALERVLVDLGRSLLQYVGESWPWTSEAEQGLRSELEELVAMQAAQCGRIVDLFFRRDWVVDFGVYPTEYTDLHYVALDYLLEQLVAGESALRDEIERAAAGCTDDPDVHALLTSVAAIQQNVVERLKTMKRNRATVAAS